MNHTDEIAVDYLVIGAGACGMAFTDELLAHSKATVAIVDRRDAPGGHWADAYPFVRLHQPSAFYGVSSVPLGADAVDTSGTNAGFYELAGPDELRAYYARVMHRHFLPSGRVHWFPSSDVDTQTLSSSPSSLVNVVSRVTGVATPVRVNKKIIDARYTEGQIPATTPPPFEVGDGARCVPVGELARAQHHAERYTIVGAGKTALDACVWLLERGVSPSAISWIKPREAWWFNRKHMQPHAQLPELYRGVALQLEAIARATSLSEVFSLLEADGVFLRIDANVAPTMFRGAIVSEAEVALLRTIKDVVRLGHVKRIERDRIILDNGSVATTPSTLHVHCATDALARPPLRPIFEGSRVTLQPFFWGFACYQAATLGVIEATVDDDDNAKNALCPPIHYWNDNADYASAFAATMVGDQTRAAHPALRAWVKQTRLNPASGLAALRDDPRVKECRARIEQAAVPAMMNLGTLSATVTQPQ